MPAIAEIVRAAKGRRIVMLNEDHLHQQHRAFALQLLKALKQTGFTHFAAETFTANVKESLVDGSPDLQAGVYLFDPFFADLVRQAATLGFVLVPYEERRDQQIQEGTMEEKRLGRESAQASNLAAVLLAEPTSRIFVYAGGSHIEESVGEDGRRWMAGLLAERSRLDPLTVNQVWGTPNSAAKSDSQRYAAVTAKHKLGEPFVVVDDQGYVSDPKFDMIVFHPPSRCTRERPQWQSMNGYRKHCPLKFIQSAETTLFRAFVAKEGDGAIAMDQVLIPAGASHVDLLLPKGEYRITRESESGDHTLGTVSIGSDTGAERVCELTEVRN